VGAEIADHHRGPVAVLGSARVARRLALQGHRVVCVVEGGSQGARLAAWAAKEDPEGRLSVVQSREDAVPFAPHRLKAVVAVSVLGGLKKGKAVPDVIRSWSRAVRPLGTILVGELAAEGWAGRMLLKLTRKIKGRVDALEPARLCALLLDAGVRRIRQVWPQGVGSYVVTCGRVGSLSDLKSPVEVSQYS
jgi:pimeloyl-ACP methyl ester carboxylesterase